MLIRYVMSLDSILVYYFVLLGLCRICFYIMVFGFEIDDAVDVQMLFYISFSL